MTREEFTEGQLRRIPNSRYRTTRIPVALDDGRKGTLLAYYDFDRTCAVLVDGVVINVASKSVKTEATCNTRS